ncbi:sensor histidine kinase [Enterococcus plantarum]|uniref:sensor histidine kinase n=1 Tax=Enterococcus plantarum TaxID=1077675 RepID=UPI001A8C18A2|nr:HAMP domain-containing sensor histidine kinase [Enterococcus plantarum]MBO0422195.1 HAMP domain-containing histidine kinase [Enterococcus plantarum]
MTLRQTIYLTYLGSIFFLLLITLYFVELTVFDENTAHIVMWTVAVTMLIISCINFFVINPVLKMIFQLQDVSRKNASGKFIKIENRTFIKEVSMLIGDYNQMVHQLEEQVTQIRKVELEKSEMISNLSHDIKTPISSLIILGEALTDNLLNEEEKNFYLNSILDICYRISDMSNELFEVVESEGLTLNIQKKEVWIDEILINILNIFKGEIDKNKRNITIIGDEINQPIYSDEKILYRIFVNVIENALKYSHPDQPIKIKIAERISYLEVCIIDRGHGIPLDEQENIFKRTYRVEKSRSTATGGYGLGLAISEQLLKKIGGSISVESEMGKGSKFFVKIPYN